MSFYTNSRISTSPLQSVVRSVQLAEGLPFAEVLSEHDIRQAFDTAECYFAESEDDIYSPAVTLWAFLSQMLFTGPARSCNAAVHRVRELCRQLGKKLPALNSGGYCKARNKIDEAVPMQLIQTIAKKTERKVRKNWKWCNRDHLYLVDGSDVTGADTPDNQEEYPQPESQAEGCGFPMMRVLILTSLITGMVRAAAMTSYAGKETGEGALLRSVIDELEEGSVVVGDQYFCSYFMIALLSAAGIDVVTRLRENRDIDFNDRETCRKISRGNWIVTLKRPVRPEWMSPEQYETMPETLELRLVEVIVSEKGFRSEHFFVTTTLTDKKIYSGEALSELYYKRWHVELDWNSLKTMMGLDDLRGKSPHMLRLEFLMGVLAYNLVRLRVASAACLGGVHPREIGFTSGLTLVSMDWVLVLYRWETEIQREDLYELSKQRVGDRKGRFEPRAVKRRPKAYPRLTRPRDIARNEAASEKNF
jgi:IS4 transposase